MVKYADKLVTSLEKGRQGQDIIRILMLYFIDIQSVIVASV
jgi:hypothetical protein